MALKVILLTVATTAGVDTIAVIMKIRPLAVLTSESQDQHDHHQHDHCEHGDQQSHCGQYHAGSQQGDHQHGDQDQHGDQQGEHMPDSSPLFEESLILTDITVQEQ